MKHIIVIGLTLLLSAMMFGQTMHEDEQTIIQMSIDLEELQPYFHPEDKARKPLLILNDGILPSDLVLMKFGERVQFMTAEELFYHKKMAYLDFNSLDVNSTKADVAFRYPIEGVIVTLKFEKVDGQWIITRKNLSEK